MLHLLNDVEAVNHFAENDMLAVEERRGHRGNEELRPVGVGPCVLFACLSAHVRFISGGETEARKMGDKTKICAYHRLDKIGRT